MRKDTDRPCPYCCDRESCIAHKYRADNCPYCKGTLLVPAELTTVVVKVLRQGGRAGLQYRNSSGEWVIRFLRRGLSEQEVELAASTLSQIPTPYANRENVREKLRDWLDTK